MEAEAWVWTSFLLGEWHFIFNVDIGTEARSGLCDPRAHSGPVWEHSVETGISPQTCRRGPYFPWASSVSLEISQSKLLLFISPVFVDKGARCFHSALAAHQGPQLGESWEGKHAEEAGPGRSQFCLGELGWASTGPRRVSVKGESGLWTAK